MTSLSIDYKAVLFNEHHYYVGCIYSTNTLFVIDKDDKQLVSDINWRYNNNYLGTHHNYFHRHLMNEPFNGANYVDHISRNTRDNRRENLRITTQTTQNHNQHNKKRGSNLPKDCGIDASELPRHVSYLSYPTNPTDKHGDGFLIDINGLPSHISDNGRFSWKTRSRNYTLREKLNMCITKLKELRNTHIELRSIIKIETDDEDIRKELVKSFNDIVLISGYPKTIIDANIYQFKTDMVDTDLTQTEQECSKSKLILQKAGKKTISNLPEDCGIKHEDIPKYCYYVAKKYKKDKDNNITTNIERHDKFVIDRHPRLNKLGIRQWSTDGSKKKTTNEKFKELLDKLCELSS
jgi:hypothetical protein